MIPYYAFYMHLCNKSNTSVINNTEISNILSFQNKRNNTVGVMQYNTSTLIKSYQSKALKLQVF